MTSFVENLRKLLKCRSQAFEAHPRIVLDSWNMIRENQFLLPDKNLKMAIILPTGQWYALSAVINDAWYCMELHVIAMYCIVLHGITWYCMVLHGIACYCLVLHGIA